MSKADHKKKNSAMAADLIRRGFPHGKRMTTTKAPPVPPINEPGSAAYRRLQNKKMQGRSK